MSTSTNRQRQPERIPPPLDQGPEVLDGAPIFDEFAPEEALALWKTVRSVRLWLRVQPEQRAEAFVPGSLDQRLEMLRAAIAGRPLLADLEALAGVLGGGEVNPEEIGAACHRMAEWAERRGAVGTAIEFMQAAAFACPDDAGLARQVALLTRQRGEFPRAETWFRQAIATGRRTKDWAAYIRSYLGLGTLQMLRGNYPAARKMMLRGLHAAKRHSSRELIAMAYHDLAVVSGRTGRSSEMRRFAGAALAAYGKGHARVPALAYDVAVFWLGQGYFAQALEVFEATPPDFGTPLDRLVRAAAIARAAGALRDRRAFYAASREVSRLVGNPAVAQGVANALVNLAHGARSIGDAVDAREYAERALEVAHARGESETVLEAETLIESTRAEGAADAPPAAAKKGPPRQVAELANNLVAAVAGV